MVLFWVISGKYSEARLQETVGSNEELIDPFRDYETAKEEWAKHAWKSVDHGTTRYRIERVDSDAPPPCTD